MDLRQASDRLREFVAASFAGNLSPSPIANDAAGKIKETRSSGPPAGCEIHRYMRALHEVSSRFAGLLPLCRRFRCAARGTRQETDPILPRLLSDQRQLRAALGWLRSRLIFETRA